METPHDNAPETLNDRRAQWADAAIAKFIAATQTERDDSLADLLADLMHWADRNGFDFRHELLRATEHYGAELREDSDVPAPAPAVASAPTATGKRFHVTIAEWAAHVAIIDAETPEAAEEAILELWAENSDDPMFRYRDGGIDGVTVEPL